MEGNKWYVEELVLLPLMGLVPQATDNSLMYYRVTFADGFDKMSRLNCKN